MRIGVAFILAATALTGCATVSPQSAQRGDLMEVGYAPGALAFGAIMERDWSRAEAQLQAAKVEADDPARLLNLAHVYRMTGRDRQAAALYRQVLAQSDDTPLELADGRVATPRQLAAKALGVDESYAALK
jgi:Tfp pilus assembly protein PilF